MNEALKEELKELMHRTPDGVYHLWEHEIKIRSSVKYRSRTVYLSEFFKPEVMSADLTEEGEVYISIGYISWRSLEGKKAQEKQVLEDLLRTLRKIDKKRNFKPLVQRFKEWKARRK